MAPQLGPADTVRILIATDNHVGYGERHGGDRKNDSWNTFEEIMVLGRERDVDMVLLAGDLFHDNKPSRKSVVNVMKILRENCLGDKPCELEILSDQSDTFAGYFNHANYEDPDINVSLPVFSIHGNHDDPSGDTGEGYNLAALDMLSTAGLVNYYGRSASSEKIEIKPVLLQKGRTKVALFGMGNVRDERLFRCFRDGKVKFFRPSVQQTDWFNIMSVHQNHVAHSEKNYLPESFLPDFLDFVIWGHEHECKIDPIYNADQEFHVMQPGSSIATSLMPGEAVAKHVAIMSITGRDWEIEKIRLKTVRPFVIREIVLSEHEKAKKLVKKENHRKELSKILEDVVEDMIEEARTDWAEAQDPEDEEAEFPKPLIRLRVDYSAPEGSRFDLENTQRFSNSLAHKVANGNDILQIHQRKKKNAMKQNGASLPDRIALDKLSLDSIRVDKLVKEFLDAQSLTILPQNNFGDAVTQYVEKDDKHAMQDFVDHTLNSQVKYLVDLDEEDEEENEMIAQAMQRNKAKLEELFAKGDLKNNRKSRLKPKPDTWDSDIDGHWADQPGALMFVDVENGEQDDDEDGAGPTRKTATKGRGRTTASAKAANGKKGAAAKTATGRARKKAVVEDEDEEEEDQVPELDDDEDNDPMILDEDVDDSEPLFVRSQTPAQKGKRKAAAATTAKSKAGPASTTRAAAASTRKMPTRGAAASQQSSISNWAKSVPKSTPQVEEISSDESDEFEPMRNGKGKR